MEELPKARYKHDCEHCIYLGHFGEYDVWYHPLYSDKCIILRYGSESKYFACPMSLMFGHLLK